ncbi:MAG TPA: 2-oxoglutarate dehydrogenase, E2 component, dihydrolipoamide succinyltransferase [Actinomycetota bacterium]|nr:2-oxoglutarate dehydrogenase, E2 component, dihydrolipoamide succinyltransferase [Actinomycetota bacterium]
MATPVKMPEIGESVTEGTITRWLKQEGDRVEADEPLFEISTDKVDTEVPSPVSGVLKTIKVREDETVQVGAELAEIEQDGDAQEDGEAGEAASDGGEQAEAGEDETAQEAAEPEGGDEEAAEPEQREAVAEAAPEEDGGGAEEEGGAEEGEEAQPAAKAEGGDGGVTVVTMPEIGESVTEGTITRWLKQEGDRVEADEPLFEISTDKVDTEVPSPAAGVLTAIKAQEDETVQVGAELAEISGEGAAKGKPAAEKPASAKKETPAAAEREKAPAKAAEPSREAPAGDGQAGDGQPGSVVSPLVRRLAREHDVDLSQVKGSGSGGRVRREDVEAYLEQRGKEPAPARQPAAAGDGKAAAVAAPAAKQPAPVPLAKGVREEVTPFPRLRRIIAERMVGSLQTSAQLTAAVEIDMTNVMRLRERAKEDFKKREGVSLSPLPFSIQAVIAAIRTYPNANSALDQDMNLHVYQDVNMGIAVDTSKGLFVPVIRNADQLNLSGLARAIADVAKRTRDGKVDPGELSGSTFTVTNTGSVGTVWDTPIINQPNAAIFATPAIVKRPVVVDDPELGEIIAVRHMMYGIITYDHRILDGADAARFLQRVKEVLEAADFAGELGLSREDAGG